MLAWAGSDIDVLVEFSRPVGLFEFVRLKAFLEDLLGCDVDLVTPEARPPLGARTYPFASDTQNPNSADRPEIR